MGIGGSPFCSWCKAPVKGLVYATNLGLCPACKSLAHKRLRPIHVEILRELLPDEVIIRRVGRIFVPCAKQHDPNPPTYRHQQLSGMEKMGLIERERVSNEPQDAYVLAWGGLRKLEQVYGLGPGDLDGACPEDLPRRLHWGHCTGCRQVAYCTRNPPSACAVLATWRQGGGL